MPKVLITSIPFAEYDETPLSLLRQANIDYVINPIGRKFNESELCNIISEFDAVIAGTDPISEKVIKNAKILKLIARMGIGLNSVDLNAAKEQGVQVTYTPDIPIKSVAELTVGMMLNSLRHLHVVNENMHKGNWERKIGRSMEEITIGLIGLGLIGLAVLNLLQGFNCRRIIVNDINQSIDTSHMKNVEWGDKEIVYNESDVITLHVPLNSKTKNMISNSELYMMKKDAIIINTARGGLINEDDLYTVMKNGHLSGAALDVFENEPYTGSLCELENCLLTMHIGAMTVSSRTQMEYEASMEVVRYFSGESPLCEVPPSEYDKQL